ncbi:hypothetical protein L211DRAFT_879955 [Terfezia boudieri ATCC MYA-4762]|uniref:Uncharacterized protein n=1 Tax=Terfezia boudieri ATCC MYA-4762 TaxID=1051890 RepID=A0A3N4LLL6_9PEZI|nr:hypothetical protein L211DRAFT_879955 [Terfezia boudieri ATCC MYA-4762]
MDKINVGEKKFILVVKKVSFGEARKLCFLALKDMRDINGRGTVYRFITTGDSWEMVRFDGTFEISKKMDILFDTLDKDEQKWMDDHSMLMDCLNVALSNGGIKKDMIMEV